MAAIHAVVAATAGIHACQLQVTASTCSGASSQPKCSAVYARQSARTANRLHRRFGGAGSRVRSPISANEGFLSFPDFPVAPVVAAAAAIGGAAIAMGGTAGGLGGGREAARTAVRRGMELFVKNDVAGSLQQFDTALQLDPSQEPYLWQRGLSLYYLGRFQEAAEQFRKDVAVNPNDTEEAIWCYLSEAQLVGPQQSRRQFLLVGADPRPVMRAAVAVFETGGDPQQILAAAKADFGRPSAVFYATLYVGLFHESEGDQEKSREYMVAATQTPYALRAGDYMAALARVHCLQRGWL